MWSSRMHALLLAGLLLLAPGVTLYHYLSLLQLEWPADPHPHARADTAGVCSAPSHCLVMDNGSCTLDGDCQQ